MRLWCSVRKVLNAKVPSESHIGVPFALALFKEVAIAIPVGNKTFRSRYPLLACLSLLSISSTMLTIDSASRECCSG